MTSDETTGRGHAKEGHSARERRPSPALSALFGVAALVTVAVVAVPVVPGLPFSAQTPAMVAIAYSLRTASPFVAPVGAVLTALLAVLVIDRRPHPLVSALAAAVTLVAGAAAWLSHQNHFEWTFAPLPSAEFARVPDVRFVRDADMVVAVEVNGDAVAYPVRQMAYHTSTTTRSARSRS